MASLPGISRCRIAATSSNCRLAILLTQKAAVSNSQDEPVRHPPHPPRLLGPPRSLAIQPRTETALVSQANDVFVPMLAKIFYGVRHAVVMFSTNLLIIGYSSMNGLVTISEQDLKRIGVLTEVPAGQRTVGLHIPTSPLPDGQPWGFEPEMIRPRFTLAGDRKRADGLPRTRGDATSRVSFSSCSGETVWRCEEGVGRSRPD
jgi:hypothetical protein